MADDLQDYEVRPFRLPRKLIQQLDALAIASGRDTSDILSEALRAHVERRSESLPSAELGLQPGSHQPLTADKTSIVVDREGISTKAGVFRTLIRGLEELDEEPLNSSVVRETLSRATAGVEANDIWTQGHSLAVSALAKRLAEAMRLSEEEVLACELAGLAHELGKIDVPKEILIKQGKLNAAEEKVVQRYPEIAAAIMRPLRTLAPLVPLVLHHQERWDGSGYPEGLKGDDIPLGAQIVGICDVYHALISRRAYRTALPEEEARQIIEQASGRLWNPQLAEELLNQVLGVPAEQESPSASSKESGTR